MAQAGYTPISLYYSSVTGSAPTAGQLVNGELGINIRDGKVFYKDAAGVVQEFGGGGGFSAVSNINTNTNAVASTLYVLTASLVLTLPSTPSVGDLVGVSNLSNTITASVARNGSNIMSLAQDLTINVLNTGFTLTYTGVTNGWVIT
tara:strand:- start:262 stop:702 length:441 start_codon:yes stop_codon:yes gene_type:complete